MSEDSNSSLAGSLQTGKDKMSSGENNDSPEVTSPINPSNGHRKIEMHKAHNKGHHKMVKARGQTSPDPTRKARDSNEIIKIAMLLTSNDLINKTNNNKNLPTTGAIIPIGPIKNQSRKMKKNNYQLI